MNEKQSQRVIHMLKLNHGRLRSTRPELLPRWKASYIDRTGIKQFLSKPDPLHFEAYAHLVEKTIKN